MRILFELKQFMKPFPAMGSWSYRLQTWLYELPRKLRRKRKQKIVIVIYLEGSDGDVITKDTILEALSSVRWEHDPTGVSDEVNAKNGHGSDWPA